jgi:Zn-dependent peptidase ImmA (M78 family)
MNEKESFEVEINNEVLKWAINTSGWDISKLAEKVGISENDLNKVLNNEKKLTITQLKKLSKLIKRPLAFFLLSELPPEEKKPLPRDYRMIPGKEGIFSKETLFTIRIARRLQTVSRELAQNLNMGLEPTVTIVTTEDNPQKIAEEYRNKVKLSENLQKKVANPNKLLNFLRDFIERQNILVFQFPMPVEDVRGFALSDDIPKVIVINSKDQVTARIFTLMHEFAHILLNESVIDMPEESLVIENQNEIEKWCNDFASEFLLPESLAREIFNENKQSLTETKTLDRLSNKWKLSKKFILYKMLELNFIDKPQFDEILKRPYKEKKMKGGPSPDVRCISEKGKRFISLVSANVNNNFITFADALGYLSIKSHHYQKVLQKIKGD